MRRRHAALLVWIACCGAIAAPATVQAQTRTQRQSQAREGRLEIGASIGVAGSHTLGTEQATETGNGVPSGSPMTLFQATSSIDHGSRFDGRVAWQLTRAFAVEGTFAVVRTHLRTAISNDFEQAAPTVTTSPLTQYTVEAGAVVSPAAWRFGRGRVRPFVTGGGGYLRQLHDEAMLVETGQAAYAGGGLKVRLRESRGPRPSTLKTIGLRADARANFTHGGFDIRADAWHAYASVTGGVFVCF